MLCPPPIPYTIKVDKLKRPSRIEPTGEINWTAVRTKRLRKTIKHETSKALAGHTPRVAVWRHCECRSVGQYHSDISLWSQRALRLVHNIQTEFRTGLLQNASLHRYSYSSNVQNVTAIILSDNSRHSSLRQCTLRQTALRSLLFKSAADLHSHV